MYQKKCAHQAVTGLGKYVPQGLPTHVETGVLLAHRKPNNTISGVVGFDVGEGK